MRSANVVVAKQLATQLYGAQATVRVYTDPESGLIRSAAVVTGQGHDKQVVVADGTRRLVEELRRLAKEKAKMEAPAVAANGDARIRRATRDQLANALGISVGWVKLQHEKNSDLPFEMHEGTKNKFRYNIQEFKAWMETKGISINHRLADGLRRGLEKKYGKRTQRGTGRRSRLTRGHSQSPAPRARAASAAPVATNDIAQALIRELERAEMRVAKLRNAIDALNE